MTTEKKFIQKISFMMDELIYYDDESDFDRIKQAYKLAIEHLNMNLEADHIYPVDDKVYMEKFSTATRDDKKVVIFNLYFDYENTLNPITNEEDLPWELQDEKTIINYIDLFQRNFETNLENRKLQISDWNYYGLNYTSEDKVIKSFKRRNHK